MRILATILLVGFGFGLADKLDLACPTITKQAINPECSKACNSADCAVITRVQNPCGCPSAIPTATLLEPCDAPCPYNGCDVEFRTSQQACGAPATATQR